MDYRMLPLEQPGQQIRLLQIRPDSDDATISTDLEVHNLQNCPPFVAISYVWGDHVPTLPIEVQRQQVHVRVNCWYALWQMRHHGQHEYFWIDSICINQSDIHEKNAQVAKMGEIYSKAMMTACCLGPGRNLTAALEVAKSIRCHDGANLLTIQRDALHTLQQNPYFRRIWIKQEIIISRDVRLFCGVDCVGWCDFEEILSGAAIYDMRHSSRKTLTQHPKSKNLTSTVHRMLMEGRQLYHSSKRSLRDKKHDSGDERLELGPWAELWRLIVKYGDAECQDPHDKIYALLGLMSPDLRSELPLTVNYGMPTLSLCLELIRNYILEFNQTSQTTGWSGIVPVEIWQTTITMIRHWFQPRLSDLLITDFMSRWSSANDFLESRENAAAQFEKLARTPEYVPGDVLYQFPIRGHLDDFLLDPSAFIFRDDDVDSDEEGFAKNPDIPASYNECFLSPVILAKNIRTYLLPWSRRKLGPLLSDVQGAFAGAEGDFTLSALPADLEVKVILLPSYQKFFLVSPDIVIGDDLLNFRLFDAQLERFFLAVVRPHDQTDTTRFSVLAGWALQLCLDASLLHHSDIGYGGYSIPQRQIDWNCDVDPNLEGLPRDTLFNFHYEDLILNSILMQNAAAYVEHSCTHKQNPSFFKETFQDKGLTQNELESESSSKASKAKMERGVGFA